TIRGPNASGQQLTVPFNKVVIGSGAHCEVQLPQEHAAVEHVELTLVNGRVYARARVFDPAPTIGGSPFVQTFVEPGVAIGVGPFRIVAAPTAVAGKGEGRAAPSTLKSPVFLGGALLAVGLLAAVGLKRNANAGVDIVQAPSLWGAVVASCPQSAQPQALALARERRLVAEGKRERRPFHVQDGVAAVGLFETASACFAAGGDSGAASETADDARTLRSKVQEDYHAHQVRLEHALLVNDSPTAQREVKVLRAFTDAASGPYVVWLSNLDRKLQLELAKDHPA
ncbi:MAG TPA: hypothetical protein VGI39_23150, partial [Polyangiaceae bacterium]